jgi:HEAT repeat protein
MALNPGMLRIVARAGLALALCLPSAVARGADPAPPQIPTQPNITEVGGRALKDWIADLKNPDPSVREEAIRAIVLFGPAAGEAVPALIEHVNDPDTSPRAKAIMVLGRIEINEKDRKAAIDALGKRLEIEGQSPIRYDLAQALMKFGKEAKPALSGLLQGADDTSCFEVRRICIAVLMEAGQTDKGPDPRVTHLLLRAVRDRAASVRLHAIMALGEMGRPADESLCKLVLDALDGAMSDKDKTVVIWAHTSKMAITGKADKDDVNYLLSCAQTAEAQRVRLEAIRALGGVGKRDDRVVPRLVELMAEKESPDVIGFACLAMAGIESPGKDAETALNEVAQNAALPLEVRLQAVGAMGAIGAKSRGVVPLLINLLHDKDPNIVSYACSSLGHIGDPGSQAEQALNELIQNPKAEKAEIEAARDALEQIRKAKMK